jgi:hypothetical protein
MRIVPFEVLEEHAREEYRQRFANAPEPKVLNARALAVYDSPRSFVWGGVGYWAPPLSYESGVRLMIAANALRDLRDHPAAKPSTGSAAPSGATGRARFSPTARWNWKGSSTPCSTWRTSPPSSRTIASTP